ncbi:MAG TPA: SRPBCC family protein [Actinomycetota bacterium]|nr:SRPBCC family protein [Actinomycetota bacterium]
MLDVTGRRDAVESSVIAPMRGRVAVIEAEADIRRSPEDVFDYASDPAHEPEWNIRMKRLEKLTDGPVSVGAGYRMEFTQGPPAISECVLRAPQPLGAGRRVEGNQLRL